MKNLNTYITEKFKISKDIKGSGDGEILFSSLKKCVLGKLFPEELFINLKEWLEEVDSFEVFIRNYKYLELDKELNFIDSKFHDTKNKTFSSEFEDNFPDYGDDEDSNKKYIKYSASDESSILLINENKDAFYFNFYVQNKNSNNNPWFEMLIIKK